MIRVESQSEKITDNEITKTDLPFEAKILFKALHEHFNKIELKALCLELDIKDDNLKQETMLEFALELVNYVWRRGQLLRLEEWVRQNRPDVYKQKIKPLFQKLFKVTFNFFFPEITITLTVDLPVLNSETEKLVIKGIRCLLCSLLGISLQSVEGQIEKQVLAGGKRDSRQDNSGEILITLRVPRESALKLKKWVEEDPAKIATELPGFKHCNTPYDLDKLTLTPFEGSLIYRHFKEHTKKKGQIQPISPITQLSELEYLIIYDPSPKQLSPMPANNTLSPPSITPPLSSDLRPDFSYNEVTISGPKQESPVLDQTNLQFPIPRLDAVLPGLLEEALQDKPQIPEPKFKETLPKAVIGHSDFDLAYNAFMRSLEKAPDSKFIKRGDVITKRNDGITGLWATPEDFLPGPRTPGL